jgi:CO/xanthine dehydrogenase FAD-binding subunit
MRVLLPESFAEACALRAEGPDRIAVAGGTDLLVGWPQRFDLRDATFIDLSKLAELKSITWASGSLVLGAATTYWDVQRDTAVAAAFPLLAKAARSVGALQIQTRGTWAGNVIHASPAADGAAVLLAHEAVLELVSSRDRELISLADFYRRSPASRLRPDQLVQSIRVPCRNHSVLAFDKVGSRAAFTIANLSLTIARSEAGWRMVAGGMGPQVARCPSLERLIASETPIASPDELLAALRADLAPVDDIRASAAYRERVMARLAFTRLAEACPWITGRL